MISPLDKEPCMTPQEDGDKDMPGSTYILETPAYDNSDNIRQCLPPVNNEDYDMRIPEDSDESQSHNKRVTLLDWREEMQKYKFVELEELENLVMSEHHVLALESLSEKASPSGTSQTFVYNLSDFLDGKPLVCTSYLGFEDAQCKALGYIVIQHWVEGESFEYSDVTKEYKFPQEFNQYISQSVQWSQWWKGLQALPLKDLTELEKSVLPKYPLSQETNETKPPSGDGNTRFFYKLMNYDQHSNPIICVSHISHECLMQGPR